MGGVSPIEGGSHFAPPPPDEREAVQKKTFTKWVNSHLARSTARMADLYCDLRDGRLLLRLLELLSGEALVRDPPRDPRPIAPLFEPLSAPPWDPRPRTPNPSPPVRPPSPPLGPPTHQPPV